MSSPLHFRKPFWQKRHSFLHTFGWKGTSFTCCHNRLVLRINRQKKTEYSQFHVVLETQSQGASCRNIFVKDNSMTDLPIFSYNSACKVPNLLYLKPKTVYSTPGEFENGGFTLKKTSNVFRPHYAGGVWKRRFHSENASNVFRPHYAWGI